MMLNEIIIRNSKQIYDALQVSIKEGPDAAETKVQNNQLTKSIFQLSFN